MSLKAFPDFHQGWKKRKKFVNSVCIAFLNRQFLSQVPDPKITLDTLIEKPYDTTVILSGHLTIRPWVRTSGRVNAERVRIKSKRSGY